MIDALKIKLKTYSESIVWHYTTLEQSIRHLGLYNGVRYYKVSCRCKKNPAIIEDWASTCQAEAMNTTDPALKAALQSWAKLLREHLRVYLASKEPKQK